MNQTLAIPISLIVLAVAALAVLAASNSGIQTFTSGTESVANEVRCSSEVEDVCSSPSYVDAATDISEECSEVLVQRVNSGQCASAENTDENVEQSLIPQLPSSVTS